MQEALKVKKDAERLTDLNRCDETVANYKLTNMAARKAVAKAKYDVCKYIDNSLAEGKEGQ